MRACAHCGTSIAGYRRQARHCGGPCRAAASRASRARTAERSNSVVPAPEPSALDKSAQKRTQEATWPLAAPAEEALAERLHQDYPELSEAA
jgi:hypothetical protein